jgi:hypothetical protein
VAVLLLALGPAAAGAAPAAEMPAPAGRAPAAVTVDADAGLVNAARGLGPGVVFFTSRARPLKALDEIRAPAREAGTGDFSLARDLMDVLRAGGVKLNGGVLDLMRLASASHFSALFREHPELRFFAVRARPDGSERAIAEKGGGVRLILRARDRADLVAGGEPAGPAPAGGGARTGEAKAPFVTSFGPLAHAALGPTARQRTFHPQEGTQVQVRQARKGQAFLVLHIERDFSAGLGTISFLFGSGVMLKPEFESLQVKDGGGKRRPPAAVYDEGRTLELAYEVPAGARGLTLEDGDRQRPLADLLAAPASPARAAAQ